MSVLLAEREDVVGAIDSEIAQLETHAYYRYIGDVLCALTAAVEDAMDVWNSKPGQRDVLERFRQIAGLSARAMALYGATYAPPVMSIEKGGDEQEEN